MTSQRYDVFASVSGWGALRALTTRMCACVYASRSNFRSHQRHPSLAGDNCARSWDDHRSCRRAAQARWMLPHLAVARPFSATGCGPARRPWSARCAARGRINWPLLSRRDARPGGAVRLLAPANERLDRRRANLRAQLHHSIVECLQRIRVRIASLRSGLRSGSRPSSNSDANADVDVRGPRRAHDRAPRCH